MDEKQSIKKWICGVLIFMVFFVTGCAKEPVRIGVIGSLTSKQSQLSIDARNAIEVGVEFINREGGIDGASIELVVKDDASSFEVAQKRYQEFLDEDVHLILGHMTSNMAEAVQEAQDLPLLFLSPSMSTNLLLEKDDNFLRTSPLTDGQALTFLEFVLQENYREITVVYDIMNREYTEYLAQKIEELSGNSDGMKIRLLAFDSRIDNLGQFAEQMDLSDTEYVLLISQATDTAFMAQKIKQRRNDVQLCSVSWSMTQDLIQNGGSAVEDMHFIGMLKTPIKSEAYLAFQAVFLEKFNYEPSFVSFMAYDALNAMAKGIENAESLSPEDVKASILELGEFQGLEERFQMNVYGDCNRGYQMYELKNDEFIQKQ